MSPKPDWVSWYCCNKAVVESVCPDCGRKFESHAGSVYARPDMVVDDPILAALRHENQKLKDMAIDLYGALVGLFANPQGEEETLAANDVLGQYGDWVLLNKPQENK